MMVSAAMKEPTPDVAITSSQLDIRKCVVASQLAKIRHPRFPSAATVKPPSRAIGQGTPGRLFVIASISSISRGAWVIHSRPFLVMT